MSDRQPRTLTDSCGCPRHEMTAGVFQTHHVLGTCRKPLASDCKAQCSGCDACGIDDDIEISIGFSRLEWQEILAAIDRGHKVSGSRNVTSLTLIEDRINEALGE